MSINIFHSSFSSSFRGSCVGGRGCNDHQIITNGYAFDRPANQVRLLSISRFTGYEHKDYRYYYRRTTCVVGEAAFTRVQPAMRKGFYFRSLKSRVSSPVEKIPRWG